MSHLTDSTARVEALTIERIMAAFDAAIVDDSVLRDVDRERGT